MTENDLTYAALDKGHQEQIGKLYAVFLAASEADVRSGLAIERFAAGLERARTMREAALACVRS